MLMLLAALSSGLAADLDRGARLYRTSCLACHGASLAGDGPAAAAIKPRPTNLADPAWWEGRDDASVRSVIQTGKPGTAMMAFGQLTEDDTESLVAYLRSVVLPESSAATVNKAATEPTEDAKP